MGVEEVEAISSLLRRDHQCEYDLIPFDVAELVRHDSQVSCMTMHQGETASSLGFAVDYVGEGEGEGLVVMMVVVLNGVAVTSLKSISLSLEIEIFLLMVAVCVVSASFLPPAQREAFGHLLVA
jgi:hypothetical protein